MPRANQRGLHCRYGKAGPTLARASLWSRDGCSSLLSGHLYSMMLSCPLEAPAVGAGASSFAPSEDNKKRDLDPVRRGPSTQGAILGYIHRVSKSGVKPYLCLKFP